MSSVFNTLSSVSFLLLAVLLSSPSQSLPNNEDYDGEDNYTAREREDRLENTETQKRKKKEEEGYRGEETEGYREEERKGGTGARKLQEEGVGLERGKEGLEQGTSRRRSSFL